MFTLVDDGTLDTTLRCTECGTHERFLTATLLELAGTFARGSGRTRDSRLRFRGKIADAAIDMAFEIAEEEHECRDAIV